MNLISVLKYELIKIRYIIFKEIVENEDVLEAAAAAEGEVACQMES